MMLITTNDELIRHCQPLHRVEYITIDTEFIRESTFFPELCLIQIAGPEIVFAIDPLSPDIDLSPLFEILKNPDVLKVFHAARQDIEIIYNISGIIPTPIFDTQIAAMVCGFGESVSYETLVMQLTHKKLDKSQRYSDWRLRPLNEKQIQYALGDVIYLRQVYTKLQRRLTRNNRTEWLKEEIDALYDKTLYAPHPEEAWRKLKPKKIRSKISMHFKRASGLAGY
jgi:ribonuclease D